MGKVQALEIDFNREELDFVGIQEGRIRENCVKEGTFYIMFTSAATRGGQLGVQFCVRTTARFQALCIYLKSPRLMTVVGVYKSVLVAWVVGHAPIEAAVYAEKVNFWEMLLELVSALKRKHGSAHIVLLIDGNSRLSSYVLEAVGGCEVVKESENGHLLHAFLTRSSLKAVNTFFSGWVHVDIVCRAKVAY